VRIRSITTAAVLSLALLGGFAAPVAAAPATKPAAQSVVDVDGLKTLLATTPDGGALYADGIVPDSPVAKTKARGGDCGWVTCSYYFTRSQTRKANTNINLVGGGINGLAASCAFIAAMGGPAAPIVAAACGVSIVAYGSFLLDAIQRAAASNKCLRVRWLVVGGGYSFYADGSKYCKN